jgi:hypothetical protein
LVAGRRCGHGCGPPCAAPRFGGASPSVYGTYAATASSAVSGPRGKSVRFPPSPLCSERRFQ